MDADATEVLITLSSPFGTPFNPETVSSVTIEDNGSGFPEFKKSKYPMFEMYTASNTRSTKQGAQKASNVGGCGMALKIIHDWIAEDAKRNGKEGEFAFDKGNRAKKLGARLHFIYESKPLTTGDFDRCINPDYDTLSDVSNLSSATLSTGSKSSSPPTLLADPEPSPVSGIGAGAGAGAGAVCFRPPSSRKVIPRPFTPLDPTLM